MEPSVQTSGGGIGTKYSDLFYNPRISIAITGAQFAVGIALYVLSYYLFDDGLGSWDITASNMFKAIIGILLLPFGLILWQSAIFRLSSHCGYHYIANVAFLSILVIACFTIGAVYFVLWDIQLFLEWSIEFTSSNIIRTVQAIYLVLTLWLSGITTFHILLRLIIQRNLYNEESMYGLNDNQQNDNNNNNENQPLIQSEMTGITTTTDANDKGIKGQTNVGRPMNKSERDTEETASIFFEYASIFLFYFVFIPIFLWLNCILVSDWHRLIPSTINQKLQTWSITDSWNTYFTFQCLDYSTFTYYTTCYARLYFDVLYWYQFIFWVSLFSYIVHKSNTLKLFVRKRVLLNINLPYNLSLISITVGEILFWVLWMTMMILVGYYFMTQHFFDDDSTKTVLEKWARYMGILSIQLLACQLFTITRIRLWIDCFAVSTEHLIVYHRMFGVLMLFCAYLHMTLWLIFWSDTYDSTNDEWYIEGNLPFGTIEFTYHADNWTPILMYYVMIFLVPVVYIIGTFEVIRRDYFEIFYYLHLFGGLIFITSMLWHATQSWRYLIPPLMLYAIDRMIRLSNSSRLCRVENLTVSVDGIDNDNNIEVTKLSFTIGSYSIKYGESSFRNINFKMGQYGFINISNISLYEWHPFTISSGEDENETYFQIQNEGPAISDANASSVELSRTAQFTTMLYILSKQVESQEKGINDIELHVDGPYGKPFDYTGYERVILVAGGIGITPCHSIFNTILSRSIKYNGHDINGNVLPSIDLIWVCRDSAMFSMFTSTWRLYEDHNQGSNNKFSVRLFVTRRRGGNGNNNNDDEEKKDNEFNHVVPHTDATMYTYGRPNWLNVLQIIRDNDNKPNKTLVFSCGPQRLINDVERVSVKYGAQFYSESFQF